MTEKIKVKAALENGVEMPAYATKGSAGFDFRAFIKEEMKIEPNKTYLIPTGIKVQLPEGYELQVRSRSGLSLKHGLIVLNAPGTVDSDYRGEIKLIMFNAGSEIVTIQPNDRLAQGVLTKVIQAEFDIAEDLDISGRGDGGFGSTGKK